MSAKLHEQAHELRAVHQATTSGDAQHDGPQQSDTRPGSSSSPPARPTSPASIEDADTVASFQGEGATFHVNLFDHEQPSRSPLVHELQTTRATQTTPARMVPEETPLPPQQPQQRPQQQHLHQRRRRARIRMRVWLTSKIYVIKIALASKKGKLLTTCTFAFIQISAIIALLVASAYLPSRAAPGLSQWDACPRRLQAFDIIQLGKAAVGWAVNVWWILRQPNDAVPTNLMPRIAYRMRQDFLPYFTAILHIVLSAVLFSTLTGSPTTWDLSPTIFFACIVALFRTWLAVAEVVLLVVGGAIYAICYASLAIFCPSILPRRAARLGGINPTIGPLSPTQLNQIPIVQYASMSTVSLALPTTPGGTLGRLRLKRNDTSQASAARQEKGPKRHKIEKHRAACAICLNDFIDMKRVNNAPPIEPPLSAGTDTRSHYGTAPSSPVSPTHPASQQRSEGTGVDVEGGEEASFPVVFVGSSGAHVAGEDPSNAAPTEPEELRLLPCDHVFHKDCIDPWLKDVSGRCPTCQRPVFGGDGDDAV